MTMKKDAVGNNPLSHLIPRGPAPRPSAPAAPLPSASIPAPAPAPAAAEPVAATPTVVHGAPLTPVPATLVAAPVAHAAPAASPTQAMPSSPPSSSSSSSSHAPASAADDDAEVDSVASGAGATALKRCTVRLPVALLERMTSAIVHTPGMTQADFVADALVAHLAALERERGSAFPAYGKRLRPGRKSW